MLKRGAEGAEGGDDAAIGAQTTQICNYAILDFKKKNNLAILSFCDESFYLMGGMMVSSTEIWV